MILGHLILSEVINCDQQREYTSSYILIDLIWSVVRGDKQEWQNILQNIDGGDGQVQTQDAQKYREWADSQRLAGVKWRKLGERGVRIIAHWPRQCPVGQLYYTYPLRYNIRQPIPDTNQARDESNIFPRAKQWSQGSTPRTTGNATSPSTRQETSSKIRPRRCSSRRCR